MQTQTESEIPLETLYDFRLIPLTRGLFAIVDYDDYNRLNEYKWHVCRAGYAQRCSKGKTIKMHNEIIDVPPGMVCDHINHNTLDNRKCNLRVCTPAQNKRNRMPNKKGTSRYKGVFWKKDRRKWCAEINYNNEKIHLGYFDYEQDAAICYDDMAIELFGPFACLNFNCRPELAEWMEQTYLIRQKT